MKRRLRFALGAWRCTVEERALVGSALWRYRAGGLSYSTDRQAEVAEIEQLLAYGYRKAVPEPIFDWNR